MDLRRVREVLRRNALLLLTGLAVVLGFALGFGLREVTLSRSALLWLDLPGYCFLNCLKFTIVPLLTSSVISAVATLNPRENGKLGAIQLSYLTLTNILGATMGTAIGVAYINLDQSKVNTPQDYGLVLDSSIKTEDLFADLIRNLFPDSIIRVGIQKVQTFYVDSQHKIINETITNKTMQLVPYLKYTEEINILGLLAVSLVFGLAASKAGKRGRPFIEFTSSTRDVMITMLGWFVWLAPVGILSLIAVSISQIELVGDTFRQLGYFFTAVCLGLMVHQLVVVPLIYLIICRRSIYFIYPHSVKAWLVAFSTGSSAATMPYMYRMIDVAEVGWDKEVAGFAVPIACSMNADGSALYIAVACLFLSHLSGVAVTVSNIFIIWSLTAIGSSALPAVPSASLVTVVIICVSIGIPSTQIGILFTVEWMLDRLRTTSNVISEIVSVSLLNHFYKKFNNKESKEANQQTFDQGNPEHDNVAAFELEPLANEV